MNQKVLLVGIIALILFGVGGYILGTKKSQPSQTNSLSISPTAVQPDEMSDPTANWKTYNGRGFSFKYPDNLELATSSADDIFYIQTIGWTTEKATLADSYRIQIIYLKNNTSSAEEYMNLDSDKIPPLPKPDFTQTLINGISTIIKSYKDESYLSWGGNKQYYVYKDNKRIIFDGSGKNHKILDQILSTFKFTN